MNGTFFKVSLGLAAAIGLVGCTWPTACEFLRAGSYYCWQDEYQDFCEDGGGVWHESTSCEELGYTYQCTDDEVSPGIEDKWTVADACDESEPPPGQTGGAGRPAYEVIPLPDVARGQIPTKVVATNNGLYVSFTGTDSQPYLARYDESSNEFEFLRALPRMVAWDVLRPDDDGPGGDNVVLLLKDDPAPGLFVNSYSIGFLDGTESRPLENDGTQVFEAPPQFPSSIAMTTNVPGWIVDSSQLSNTAHELWRDTGGSSGTGKLFTPYGPGSGAQLRVRGRVEVLQSGASWLFNNLGIVRLQTQPEQDVLMADLPGAVFGEVYEANGRIFASTSSGDVYVVVDESPMQIAQGKSGGLFGPPQFAVGDTHLFFQDGTALPHEGGPEMQWITADALLLSAFVLTSHPGLTHIYAWQQPDPLSGSTVPQFVRYAEPRL